MAAGGGQAAKVRNASTKGGQPATVLGSSLGGCLANLYAARHPEVVRAVMLEPAFNLYRRWRVMLGEAAVKD